MVAFFSEQGNTSLNKKGRELYKAQRVRKWAGGSQIWAVSTGTPNWPFIRRKLWRRGPGPTPEIRC
jgi:hypothetical protein